MQNTFFKMISVVSLMALTTTVLALEVTAKNSGTKIVAEPNLNAPALGTVKKGEKLQVGNRVGMYWSVDFNGQKGFVKVSDTVSASNSEATKVMKYNTKRDDSARTSRQRATAVMGIRGLDDKEDVSKASVGKPSGEMTRKMESRQVDPKKVSDIEKSVNEEMEKKTLSKDK